MDLVFRVAQEEILSSVALSARSAAVRSRLSKKVDGSLVLNPGVVIRRTHLLESEWVLRSVYGFSAGEVAAALRAFAGLPGVSVENSTRLADALGRVEQGMYFADALHLGAAARCEALLTFDRRFIDLAGDSRVRVMEP